MAKPPVVPPCTIRYYGPGETCTDPDIGDLILVRTDDIFAKVIQFGEGLRLRGEDKVFARVNHAMTVVANTPIPRVQQMIGGGGVVTDLSGYLHLVYAVVNVSGATTSQRFAAAEAALWYVGIGYGWPSVASDSIYLLTGLPVVLTVGQSVVCSAAAAAAQRCLGLVPNKADLAVLPSDLAKWCQVRLPAYPNTPA